jgi:hypothetical protein
MSSSDSAASPRRAPQGRSPLHKRVLALVASLSLLLVGLVGVVMAPAASAHGYSFDGQSAQCETVDNVKTGKYVFRWVVGNDTDYGPLVVTKVSGTGNPTLGTVADAQSATFSEVSETGGSRTLKVNGEWTDDGYDYDSATKTSSAEGLDCTPPETFGASVDICTPDGFWYPTTLAVDDTYATQEEADQALLDLANAYDGDNMIPPFTNSAGSFPGWNYNEAIYADGDCNGPDLASELSCSAWSVDIENYRGGDNVADTAIAVNDVVVKIDGNVVGGGDLSGGSWSGGAATNLGGGLHTLTVEIYGKQVDSLTRTVTCTSPPPPPPNNPPVVPPPTDYCDTVEGTQSKDYVCPTVAVEATAVQVAPLAATVPAPAKKPIKKPVVAAPKPAKVNGGVAGSVGVPEAATLPSAVPAGDGSQSPGLPVWALALIVAGALGAAAAGKQLVGSRK